MATLLSDAGDAFPSRRDRARLIDAASHVALIPFSSGTTGMPKGVELTHRNVVGNICQGAASELLLGPTRDNSRDRTLGLLPLWHGYLLYVGLLHLYLGTTLVTLPKFEAASFLRTIEDYQVNFLPLVPPLVVFLNKHPTVKDYDLTSVKDIICGAAPLSAELQHDVMKQLNIGRIRQGWGMSELVAIGAICPSNVVKPGCSGALPPNMQMRILDVDTDKEVEPGRTGHLVVKGPQVMKGYLNNPAATSATMDSEGWMSTGDIGYFDDDDHLHVVDRLKELIKYKGHQVAPAELEGLMLTHPFVADAAVIGIPDDIGGEIPKAFVKLKPEASTTKTPSSLTSEISAFVDARVNPLSRLRGGVQIVDDIPKGASGKILRRELRNKST